MTLAAVVISWTTPMVHPAEAVIALSDPDLALETYVTGLDRPTAIDWLAPGDMLVVERSLGRVRRVVDGVLQAAIVYETPLAASGDQLIIGIAINDESPPAVFLSIEDQTGLVGNRIERHRWNPATAQLEDAEILIEITPSGMAANADDGGYLLLGPPTVAGDPEVVGDGRLLYIGVGYLEKSGTQLANDPSGDPPGNTAVIMRVHQDGSPAPGNPFTPYCSITTTQICASDNDCAGAETCTTEVARYYSYGVRNVFGLAIDPVTFELWDQENGEDEWDEINRVEPGMNSGWTEIMGLDPGDPVTLFEMPGGGSFYRDPEYTWFDTTGPTGIAFPTGSSFGSAYDDVLLVADFNQPSNIYAFPLSADRMAFDLEDITAETQAELDQFIIATGFDDHAVALEFGPDGDLYVVSHFGDGTIYRIRGPGRPAQVPALPLPWLLGLGLLVAATIALHRT